MFLSNIVADRTTLSMVFSHGVYAMFKVARFVSRWLEGSRVARFSM